MACPACGCKEHYQYCYSEFGSDDDRLERCAACRHVFDIEDSADEDDDEPATAGVRTCDPVDPSAAEVMRRALSALEKSIDNFPANAEHQQAIVLLRRALGVPGTDAPEPPPECKTEAEKIAFAFGWWKALEAQRTRGVPPSEAPSKQERCEECGDPVPKRTCYCREGCVHAVGVTGTSLEGIGDHTPMEPSRD